MNRVKLLYSLALFALVALLFEIVTGAVLWIAIPSGAGPFRHGPTGGVPNLAREFLSLNRGSWIDLHDWGAVALVALIVMHIVLHYGWLWRQTKQLLARR